MLSLLELQAGSISYSLSQECPSAPCQPRDTPVAAAGAREPEPVKKIRCDVRRKKQHSATFDYDEILPSVEAKMLSINHVPDFLRLRDHCLSQLTQIVQEILAYDGEAERSKEKRRFLHAVLAVRQVSVKLVEMYLEDSRGSREYSTSEGWQDLVKALKLVPNSLDFIDFPPFNTYSGVAFACNPFVSTHDLLGELSVSVSLPAGVLSSLLPSEQFDQRIVDFLPRELRFGEGDFLRFHALSAALCSVCQDDVANSQDNQSVKQSALAFLLFRPAGYQQLQQRLGDIEQLKRRNDMKRCVRRWRRRYEANCTAVTFSNLRRKRRLQQTWRWMVEQYDHRRGLRSLLHSAHRQVAITAWRKWTAVTKW